MPMKLSGFWWFLACHYNSEPFHCQIQWNPIVPSFCWESIANGGVISPQKMSTPLGGWPAPFQAANKGSILSIFRSSSIKPFYPDRPSQTSKIWLRHVLSIGGGQLWISMLGTQKHQTCCFHGSRLSKILIILNFKKEVFPPRWPTGLMAYHHSRRAPTAMTSSKTIKSQKKRILDRQSYARQRRHTREMFIRVLLLLFLVHPWQVASPRIALGQLRPWIDRLLSRKLSNLSKQTCFPPNRWKLYSKFLRGSYFSITRLLISQIPRTVTNLSPPPCFPRMSPCIKHFPVGQACLLWWFPFWAGLVCCWTAFGRRFRLVPSTSTAPKIHGVLSLLLTVLLFAGWLWQCYWGVYASVLLLSTHKNEETPQLYHTSLLDKGSILGVLLTSLRKEVLLWINQN